MHLPKLFCKMSVVERVKYVKWVSKVSNYLITQIVQRIETIFLRQISVMIDSPMENPTDKKNKISWIL